MLSTALLAIPFHPPQDAPSNIYILLRYIHILAGITWVGLLYFFVLINAKFLPALDAATRMKVIPALMPRALWWFRWGSVVTVLAGIWYFVAGGGLPLPAWPRRSPPPPR